MWYFSWILGMGVALGAGVISALWLESRDDRRAGRLRQDAQPDAADAGARGTA